MPTPHLLRTWTGETHECADFVAPRTEDELAAAVRAARQVRFLGSGCSMIDRIVPATGGTLIDMRAFADISLPAAPPAAATDRVTVTVGGGARLDAVTAGLAARGWALATVPTQPTVTAAGVISTGSHNTARDAAATVADQVTAIEALDASGEPYSFKGDELKAARVGLGALGPILCVTLRCVPAHDLLHAWVERDADATFADLDALMRKHDHLWLNWKLLPNDKERVVIRSADRISGAAPQVTRISGIERVPAWQRVAARVAVKLAARIPALKPMLMGSIAAKRPVIGASHHVFFQDIDWIEGRDASIAIPVEQLPAAREALRSAFRAARYQPHLPIQIRFLPASDETLLGLNAGQAVAVLELMSFSGFADYTCGLRVFCETLAGFSPRAHWAKGAVGHVASSFPQASWRAFEALRQRIDPGAKFVSPWLRSVTPLAR
jgi:hypothetical protein